MANTFHGSWNANNAIPAPQCMAGGIMNFNFGSDPPGNDGTRSHRQLEPFSTVPFPPDPDFVDRPEILGWLREMFVGDGTRAALVGLGGVGKSQLAIRFVHSIHDASPQTFVFWVHASSRAQFEEAYRDIADRLQLPERRDPKANILRLVSNWLRNKSNGQWFMVLDNVDQVDIFSQSRKRRLDEANTNVQTSLGSYIPKENGLVLVTSRNKDAAATLVDYNRIKEVLAMDEGEGLQLLRNKLCQPALDDSAAKMLVALNHIPLAITQAAAYINRSARMTVADYVDDFHRNSKKRERLLNWDPNDLRRDESASNSILIAWQMSFEQIRQERPSAAELLSLMSFFNSHGIPDWILRKYRKTSVGAAARRNTRNEEEDEDVDSELNEDLDILRAYSLISATAEDNTYEMHPLVQFCMRAWLSSLGEVDQWYHRFVVLMAQELPFMACITLARFRQLFPHIELIFDNTPTKETLRAWAEILDALVLYLTQRGSYDTVQKLAEKALSVTENTLGFKDNLTIKVATTLMDTLRYQQSFQEIEQLGQRVLRGYNKEPGKHNSSIMVVMSCLAKATRRQGRHDESEKLIRQTIETHKEDHAPFMIWRLGTVLQELGELGEAEKLFRQAIEGYKELLGELHPIPQHYMSSLAIVLVLQGQKLEVETFFRQTPEANKEQTGECQLFTLIDIWDLATALESQGRLVEAENLYRHAIAWFKEVEGEPNFWRINAMAWLSVMLKAQSRHEEAVELMRQALDELKKNGKHRLAVAWCARHLADRLKHVGQYTEAAELYQQVCMAYAAQYGSRSPETRKCYRALAALQKKKQEAGSGEGTVSIQLPQDTFQE